MTLTWDSVQAVQVKGIYRSTKRKTQRREMGYQRCNIQKKVVQSRLQQPVRILASIQQESKKPLSKAWEEPNCSNSSNRQFTESAHFHTVNQAFFGTSFANFLEIPACFYFRKMKSGKSSQYVFL